jgi:hypothetical protein
LAARFGVRRIGQAVALVYIWQRRDVARGKELVPPGQVRYVDGGFSRLGNGGGRDPFVF